MESHIKQLLSKVSADEYEPFEQHSNVLASITEFENNELYDGTQDEYEREIDNKTLAVLGSSTLQKHRKGLQRVNYLGTGKIYTPKMARSQTLPQIQLQEARGNNHIHGVQLRLQRSLPQLQLPREDDQQHPTSLH